MKVMAILDKRDSGILHNYITVITEDCSKILIFHCSKPSSEKQVNKKYTVLQRVFVQFQAANIEQMITENGRGRMKRGKWGLNT